MAKRGGCIRVVLLVFLLPVLFGLGAWFMSNLNRVMTHETADAVIVDLVADTDSDGDRVYAPVYEYEVDGATYRYQSMVDYGGAVVPDIGDRRTILYDPSNPGNARVRNIFLLLWLPIILMVIPILIVAVVFWSMRRRRKMSDEAPPWADQVPATRPDWTRQPPVTTSWEPPTVDRKTIEATFMGTEPSQMDAEGKVRYRVKARIEIDGEIHRFRSDWLDDDPTLYYMQHGNKVEVHIDPNDPSSYEVVLPPAE